MDYIPHIHIVSEEVRLTHTLIPDNIPFTPACFPPECVHLTERNSECVCVCACVCV